MLVSGLGFFSVRTVREVGQVYCGGSWHGRRLYVGGRCAVYVRRGWFPCLRSLREGVGGAALLLEWEETVYGLGVMSCCKELKVKATPIA